MSNQVMKLPWIGLEIPRPRAWDLAAVGVAILGVVVAVLNVAASRGLAPGQSVSGSLTAATVGAQTLICLGSLLLLGKTAKQGTLWGNLAAVGGTLVGMSGVLLAAALWAAA